jgi:hypothetical protein
VDLLCTYTPNEGPSSELANLAQALAAARNQFSKGWMERDVAAHRTAMRSHLKSYLFLGPTTANMALWGSMPRMIQRSPGTSCGPMMIWPFFSLMRVAAASISSTLK